jgi:uncharacterized protein
MQTREEYIYKTLLRGLETAETIIKKAITHVEEGKSSEEEIMTAKLAEDMYPFVKQIQVLTDNTKGALARLCGSQIPKYEDNEATLKDLLKRVYTTREFILTLSLEDMKNINEMEIVLPWMPIGMSWSGDSYADKFIMQNIYFHLVTSYNILRNKGVTIGKMDYLGQI